MSLSDNGYLTDPTEEYGDILNPNVFPFEKLSHHPCLILLGEPGMGKSFSLQEEYENVQQENIKAFPIVDLGAIGTAQDLDSALWHHPDFLAWKQGTEKIVIFLDSFDECHFDYLPKYLKTKLQELPVDRLILRIACRTAHWPEHLTRSLRNLYDKSDSDAKSTNVREYEICPLRRKDVFDAATRKGIDGLFFLKEIRNAHAVSFAIKPVTLQFLIKTFRTSHCLPGRRIDLYLDGCKMLCDEWNEERRDSKTVTELPVQRRLRVAGRIAAATIIGNRAAVWRGKPEDAPETDASLEEVAGGTESVDGVTFQITERDIQETLSTGLFSSRGAYRMGWAHQSYAEFLAAWYISCHNLTQQQLKSLFHNKNDLQDKIVPQLRDTAAWLCDLSPDFRKQILESNPDIVMVSELNGADDQVKKDAVTHFLRNIENNQIIDREPFRRLDYTHLHNPDLPAILRPYIVKSNKNTIARRAALEIAENCKVAELEQELATLVFDTGEIVYLREEAASALSVLGGEARKHLQPLVETSPKMDPNDNLKATALKALWPTIIDTETLFSHITIPKRDNYFGSYHYFLTHHIPDTLDPKQLPTALEWTRTHSHFLGRIGDVKELFVKIMGKAWQHFDIPSVPKKFAEVLVSFDEPWNIRHYLEKEFQKSESGPHAPNNKPLGKDKTKRRSLLCEILPLLNKELTDRHFLSELLQMGIITTDDVDWYLEQLTRCRSNEDQRKWSEILAAIWQFAVSDNKWEQIVNKSLENATLADAISEFIEPIALNSEKAKHQRQWHEDARRYELKGKEEILDPPPAERVNTCLERIEEGDVKWWTHLTSEMTLQADSCYYENDLELDITRLPGWMEADDRTRERITNAAEQYILTINPVTFPWIIKHRGNNHTFYLPAVSGAKAFLLLFLGSKANALNITDDVWTNWTPTLVDVFSYVLGNYKNTIPKLSRMCWSHAPKEFMGKLVAVLKAKKRQQTESLSDIEDVIKECNGEEIDQFLLRKLQEQGWKPMARQWFLDTLLSRGSMSAQKYAERQIRVAVLDDHQKQLVSLYCESLIKHTQTGWKNVWPVITADPVIGRKVLSSVYSGVNRDEKKILAPLDEKNLSDLYVWLEKQKGDSHSLDSLQNASLFTLIKEGTTEACHEIEFLADQYPEKTGLKSWHLIEARDNARRHNWTPITISDLKNMIADSARRVVRDETELLDIICESLERFQRRCAEEPVVVRGLWDCDRLQKKIAPKDENHLSDVLKVFLKDDLKERGIVVNREVEIRKGQETDIHVEAITYDHERKPKDIVRVIIEAKGCWNPELFTAIEKQLHDRYMQNITCCGIYVVGWFHCDAWDKSDNRNKKVGVGRIIKGNYDLENVRRDMESKAKAACKEGELIRVCMINAALKE